jgi:hypothetical protein
MKMAGTPRLEPAQQLATYHRPVTIWQQRPTISSDLATRAAVARTAGYAPVAMFSVTNGLERLATQIVMWQIPSSDQFTVDVRRIELLK